MICVKITDLSKKENKSYIASKESDCHDETDKSAFLEAVNSFEVITMGMVIAEPFKN